MITTTEGRAEQFAHARELNQNIQNKKYSRTLAERLLIEQALGNRDATSQLFVTEAAGQFIKTLAHPAVPIVISSALFYACSAPAVATEQQATPQVILPAPPEEKPQVVISPTESPTPSPEIPPTLESLPLPEYGVYFGEIIRIRDNKQYRSKAVIGLLPPSNDQENLIIIRYFDIGSDGALLRQGGHYKFVPKRWAETNLVAPSADPQRKTIELTINLPASEDLLTGQIVNHSSYGDTTVEISAKYYAKGRTALLNALTLLTREALLPGVSGPVSQGDRDLRENDLARYGIELP